MELIRQDRFETQSFERFQKLESQDKACLGTAKYQGLAYFWSHRYKHSLRHCSQAERVLVHNQFVALGLALDGESDQHDQVIRSVFGPRSV